MISYFNSAYPVRYVIAFLMALVLWLPSFISAEYIPVSDSLFNHLSASAFVGAYIPYFRGVSFLFTLISAVAVNQILKEYDLVNINNTVGMILYIVFASVIPLFTSVNTMIMANLFIVLVIQGVLNLSEVENPIRVLFNTTFYLGLASLFFTPLLFMVVIVWMALIMNRHMHVRNLMVSLAGLFLPFLFIFTWFFWHDTLAEHWHELINQITKVHLLNVVVSLSLFDMFLLAFLLLLLIFAGFKALGRFWDASINVRRNMLITFYFLLASFLLTIFFSATPLSLMILVPPASILVAAAVYSIKNKWLNITFVVYVFLVIVNHYSNYISDAQTVLFR